MTSERRGVVLLSGGLDSAVVLAMARSEGYAMYALTIGYGQRHSQELIAARRVAEALHAERQIVVNLDLRQWGGSALTGSDTVPINRDTAEMGVDIPITYVPGRNTIFLSTAMAWAETLGTGEVFIGAHIHDYSGYPDCRPDYFQAFERMADLATRTGVEGQTRFSIHAPLLKMNKTEIVRTGARLHVPFELTSSCYQPTADLRACGVCDSCILRLRAFAEAGVHDPISYVGGTSHP
ncbi:MAG: 7-cyano-7-deazaguanine synthase QueC [candidate division Zixibacteria bacterium]|nr:7-cyano-7-deazaguanine synthase QueC [candidate division Zixibacteria bacterium]